MNELQQLLIQAADEIRDLRGRNAILRAKVETMELFATVLRTEPFMNHAVGSVDVAWELNQAIERMANADKPKSE